MGVAYFIKISQSKIKQMLQIKMARRGIYQIGAAYNMPDILQRIINDNCQLIRKNAIFALYDKVTNLGW